MHLLDELREALRDAYRVESEIGRGGMACVYLAEDLKHGRRVALKVLSPELSSSMDGDRFRREIQIAARLSHPHILPVFDSGSANGLLFYTMPFVEGESLRARLDRDRQLPIDDAIAVTLEVADALSYAHSLGVVHRDIKPENILLHGGHAVVADFGIARVIQESGGDKLTQTGMSVGTATYMSPEQFSGDVVDGRSDMYSLACVLYELLVGQVPFTGPNAMAIMARHTMEMVPSIRIVRQTVPEEIEGVIMRALEKIPADRFHTVAEFKAALLGEGEATGYTRRTPTRYTSARGVRAVPEPSRRRATAYAAAAMLLLAAGGVGAAFYRSNRPHRNVTTSAGGLDLHKIAVLYLEDRSRDSSLRDVASGLTKSLIAQLGQVEGLQVISAAGVAPYARSDVADDSIARALKVGMLVQGSIQPAGKELDVGVRLVDGLTGVDFKRVSFRVPAGAFLTARDSLANSVAEILRERLGEEVRVQELRSGTANVDAWTAIERGENLQRDADSLSAAGNADEAGRRLALADSQALSAMRLDRSWPQPLIMRATVALRRARLVKDKNEIGAQIDSGVAAATAALALDPRSAGALEARGALNDQRVASALLPSQHDIDVTLDGAEADLHNAVSIAPRRATAWYQLSLVEGAKKNQSEAMVASRRAYETDAYLREAPSILFQMWATSYNIEQFSDAIHWCDEGRRRFPASPAFVRCRLYLMVTKAVTPNPSDAWAQVQALQKISPPARWEYYRRESEILTSIVLARAQLTDSARHVLARTDAGPDIDPHDELVAVRALAHEYLGDNDEAISLLEQALTAHPDHRAGFGKNNFWWWRDLQNNPRFKTLIASGR